jgi:hypothetical protein
MEKQMGNLMETIMVSNSSSNLSDRSFSEPMEKKESILSFLKV